MTPITIVCTYFQSLSLANLAAALYSIRQQELSSVHELVLVDNNTVDQPEDIGNLAVALAFPIPVRVLSYKHGDPNKTHAWSTNVAMRAASTPWVFVTRADYLLAPDALAQCLGVVEQYGDDWIEQYGEDWNGFITGNGCHLRADIDACEQTAWRTEGPRAFRALGGATFDYTTIDAGVWLARRDAYDRVGGLDESLTAWGHAQTDFQYRLHRSGTSFVRIPETLFWHPWHDAPRDLDLAHAQLRASGGDLHALWARYEGASPYTADPVAGKPGVYVAKTSTSIFIRSGT